MSAEPPEAPSTSELDAVKVDLVRAKKDISRVLHKNKLTLFVIIDRLDEFVILEDYEAQKVILEGLLACQASFITVPEIKIKLFMRSDLFSKLDFTQLGVDKIQHKCVELKWEPEGIRELIARRLAHNIMQVFRLDELVFSTNTGHLYVDPKIKAEGDRLARQRGRATAFWQTLVWKTSLFLHTQTRKQRRHARKVNFNDALNRAVITLIFPRTLDARQRGDSGPRIDFFEFVDTRLRYSSGFATPRIAIAFFEECVNEARKYYQSNPDLDGLEKNSEGEYPVILVESVVNAFGFLQDMAWKVQAKMSKRWERAVLTIRAQFEKTERFGFMEVKAALPELSHDELTQFLAFITHSGLLKCENGQVEHRNRAYRLPMLFHRSA